MGRLDFLWLCRLTNTISVINTTTVTPRAEPFKRQRGVHLSHLNPSAENTSETDTGIDIIAIHGLDIKSPETWEYKVDERHKVNWLADQHMLPAEVLGTCIFTCDWPADLFETKDSVPLKVEELALSLLQGILRSKPKKDRKILFIASCLGGIILIQALVEARGEYATIREATHGIIFLATPFRGTSFQDVAGWAQPGLRAWASTRNQRLTELLGWVDSPSFNLSRLVKEFTHLIHNPKHENLKVFTFYETGYTNLTTKIPLLSLLLPDSHKPTYIEMNKFCGLKDKDLDYKKVVDTIQRFLVEIQAGTPLGKADAWIRTKHYTPEKLKIERLSGDPLEMDKCYINLALVQLQHVDSSKQTFEDPMLRPSRFSLAERLKLQALHETLRVELPQLFQPRKLPNGSTKEPRRILIRGRAGVGKTTLCKKIIHDFVHENMWQDLFNRVVWVRLRELKDPSNNGYNLGGMLYHIFFQQHENGESLSSEMQRHINETESRDTLFLLDGLDEVTEVITERRQRRSHPRHELLKDLLSRPNIIITTRPHAAFPHDFQPPDLDLDTIGFNSDQVRTYIEAVMPSDSDAIQTYLERNRIMQSLVQIPIQLDALCFTWQESSEWSNGPQAVPETMTAVYETMVKELWKKDNERLVKEDFPVVGNLSPAEIEPFSSIEYENLGYLALSGLCSDVIEFRPHHRDVLYKSMKRTQTKLALDETFASLSFLRTSDSSMSLSSQSFHFIHLTFQEYFSSKYFVKAWTAGQELRYTELSNEDLEAKDQEISCFEFLQRHKYTARYDIMWRFVAGLLDAERRSQIFFKDVERDPIDLLGPTHQRLVMHCLNEAVNLPKHPVRAKMEERLKEWVLFESEYTGASTFASESELPDQILRTALIECRNKSVLLRAVAYSGRYLSQMSINTLIDLFTDDDSGVRSYAAEAVGNQSKLPDTTMSALVDLFKDEDSFVRYCATEAISKQSKLPDTTMSALMDLFKDEESDVRRSAVEAVGKQSKLPATTMSALVDLFKDEDSYIRRSAVEAIGKQSKLPDTIMSALADLLKHEDSVLRCSAAEAIGNQFKLPDTIISALADILKHEDSVVRRSAAEAIGKQSKLPDTIMSALIDLFKHENSNVRRHAAEAVGTELNLINKVLDALLLSPSNREISFAHFQHTAPLYAGLLWRAFDEQFILYSTDNLMTINQSSELRTAVLEKEDLLRVWPLVGRRSLKDITTTSLFQL